MLYVPPTSQVSSELACLREAKHVLFDFHLRVS